MIDLHSHTTASDGELEPSQQVALAAAAGVRVLAVTDHDTIDGLQAAAAAARTHGLRFVPGIEITAALHAREIHILGHFIDPSQPQLSSFAGRLKAERETRMAAMVDRLKAMGFPITFQMVQDIAGEAVLTRPHLARVLTELGYCSSTKDAFNRFLGDGKPAHVVRLDVGPEEAIGLIRQSGGVATIAHPGVSRIDRLEMEGLKRAGLSGIEIDHSDHPPSLREKLSNWAAEFELVATAGSDFHGPEVAPGRVFGKESMSPEALSLLEARR